MAYCELIWRCCGFPFWWSVNEWYKNPWISRQKWLFFVAQGSIIIDLASQNDWPQAGFFLGVNPEVFRQIFIKSREILAHLLRMGSRILNIKGESDWNLYTNVWQDPIGYHRANVPNQLQANPLFSKKKATNSSHFSGATCMDLARDVGDKATMSWGPQAEGVEVKSSCQVKKHQLLVDGISQETFSLLGGGFKHLICFTPTWRNDPIWPEHIFQMGWFNHQLALHLWNWRVLWRPFFFVNHFLSSPNKGGYVLWSGWHWGGGEPYETVRVETCEWYFFHVALLTYKAGLLGSCRWPELTKNLGFDGF